MALTAFSHRIIWQDNLPDTILAIVVNMAFNIRMILKTYGI
ncbi:hypothetical protein ABID22_004070 [Pontibacter aydingkolensis]